MVAKVQGIVSHHREPRVRKHSMHDTGRVGQGDSAGPQKDGTGAGWAQGWPNAASIPPLHPMLQLQTG